MTVNILFQLYRFNLLKYVGLYKYKCLFISLYLYSSFKLNNLVSYFICNYRTKRIKDSFCVKLTIIAIFTLKSN